jgi:hypothetical protein
MPLFPAALLPGSHPAQLCTAPPSCRRLLPADDAADCCRCLRPAFCCRGCHHRPLSAAFCPSTLLRTASGAPTLLLPACCCCPPPAAGCSSAHSAAARLLLLGDVQRPVLTASGFSPEDASFLALRSFLIRARALRFRPRWNLRQAGQARGAAHREARRRADTRRHRVEGLVSRRTGVALVARAWDMVRTAGRNGLLAGLGSAAPAPRWPAGAQQVATYARRCRHCRRAAVAATRDQLRRLCSPLP